jgi:hypothetical protein
MVKEGPLDAITLNAAGVVFYARAGAWPQA